MRRDQSIASMPCALALRFPITASILVLFISVFALMQIQHISFDDKVFSAFESDSRAFEVYTQNKQHFRPVQHDQAVLLSSDTFKEPIRLGAVRDLVLEISLIDGVDETYSIFSLPKIDNENGVQTVLPFEFSKTTDLSKLLNDAYAHPLAKGTFITKDFTQLLIVYTSNFEALGQDGSRNLLDDIRQIADQTVLKHGITYELTGPASIADVFLSSLYGDLIKLNLIGGILGFLFGAFALRSVTIAALTMFPSYIALIWTLGAMSFFGIPIDTFTNIAPLLTLILSLADSLHMTFELRRQTAEKASIQEALQKYANRMAPACVLTSLTTALAFATLLISDFQLVKNLALAGVLGTLIAMFAILIIHPILFRFILKQPRLFKSFENAPIEALSFFDTRSLLETSFSFRKPIAFVTLALLAVCTILHTFNVSNYSVITLISPSAPEVRALRQLEEKMTPPFAIDLSFKTTSESIFDEVVRDDLEQIHRSISNAFPKIKISSPLLFLDWFEAEHVANPFNKEAILEELPENVIHDLWSQNTGRILVRVHVADKGAQVTQVIMTTLDQAIKKTTLANLRFTEQAGLLAMLTTEGSRLIKRLNISFLMAVLITGTLVSIWFRNWRYGLFAIVPNALPIVMVGAGLYLLGWNLHIPSAIALTIAFGIAVDDTIHTLNRVHLIAPLDNDYDEVATKKAFYQVSPALIATTIILASGTLGTQFSNISAVSYFGILAIVIFVLALVSVLLTLPALLSVYGEAQAAKKSHRN